MHTRTHLLATSLLLAASGASLHAQSAERFTVAGDRIAIWNIAGRATIEPTTGNEVVVEVTRGGEDGARLTVESTNGRLVVKYPSRGIQYRSGRDWNWNLTLSVLEDGTFSGDYSDESDGRAVRVSSRTGEFEGHADLRILVPSGRRVQVNLGVGEIDATNVDGDLELRTRVSSVRAIGSKGRLAARTGSGRVIVERSEAEVQASTGSGSIELRNITGREVRASTGSGSIEGADITTDRFDANTGSGGMRIDDLSARDLRASAGSGAIRLTLTKVADANIRTGSGGVELTLPASANVEVDISTGSGGISSDFPVTMDEVRRRELRGRIGTGADGRVRVSTGSGGARLYRR